MPFISVIVPVYNVEKYITRCVESLTGQSFQDYEILLIDDGSTDKSGILCDEIEKGYDKVKTYHKRNGGLASARNSGLKCAEGKYVVFVDSDDWVTDDFLEFIYNHLNANPVDILKYGFQRVSDNKLGEVIVPYYDEGIYKKAQIKSDILPGAIGPIQLFNYDKNALMSACTCAYSTSFLKKNNISFVSERKILNEDHLFNFHALLCADKVEVTHKILYLYDFREGSLSKCYINQMVERKIELIKTYKNLLDKYKVFSEFEEEYYSQCVDSFYACITNECGNWGKNRKFKEISKKVYGILKNPNCKMALKKCKHNNLTLKGYIIYYLMKFKMSKSIVWLYIKMKG